MPARVKRAIEAAALTALITACLTACSQSGSPQASSQTPAQNEREALACADSIAQSNPESSLLTGQCQRSNLSLQVLSPAQERYAHLQNLTTELTTKLETAETRVQTITGELEQNSFRTTTIQEQLFDAHQRLNSEASRRIQSNMDTQSMIEESSEDIATMTVSTVQSRIELASQLEEEWIGRYTNLENQYNELRDLLSQQGSQLLTAQIQLDHERSEFDRIVQTAIIEGTRRERDKLKELQRQTETLHATAQATHTQALADLEAARELMAVYETKRLRLATEAQTIALQQNSAQSACQDAWTALQQTTMNGHDPAALDRAWAKFQDACTSPQN